MIRNGSSSRERRRRRESARHMDTAVLETDLWTNGRTPFAVAGKVHRGLILKYAAVAHRRHRRRGENVKPR